MEMVIKQLKEKLALFNETSYTANDLGNKVLLWLLEEHLDYDRNYMYWPSDTSYHNQYTEIFIKMNDEDRLIVLVKKYEDLLEEDDFQQLTARLNGKNAEWGILTNGREFCLINRTIDAGAYGKNSIGVMEKLVLRIKIGSGRKKGENEKYLKYLSKKNIFDKKVTYFYRDVAVFFSLHPLSKSSREKYANTLFNFFDDYIERGNLYQIYKNGKHTSLEEISENDVITFLKAERPGGRPYSGKVPKAKCSHFSMMFGDLTDAGYIKVNKMTNLLERATKEFTSMESIAAIENNILTKDVVQTILSKLEEQHKPAKVMIFVLCAYYGFDRSQIVDFFALPWSGAIDFEKRRFLLNGRELPMVQKLYESLEQMKKGYQEKGIVAREVYVSKKGDTYVPVKKDVVNSLFDEDIKTIEDGNVNWKFLNPQNVRAMLIFNMCKNKCPLDFILFLTGATVSQIMRYVTDEMVEKTGKKISYNKTENCFYYHPFKDIFDKKTNRKGRRI